MGEHVRVLEARVQPGAVGGATWVTNGEATKTRSRAKKHAIAADDRDRPGQHLAHEPPVQGDRGRAHARQDEEPEEQRALLPAPEGGERVAERQLAARVLGDVGEGEVVAGERGEQDDARRPRRSQRRRRARSSPTRAAAGVRGRPRSRRRPRRRGRARRRRRGRRGRGSASGRLGGVLRRALRHERVRDEDAVPELPRRRRHGPP